MATELKSPLSARGTVDLAALHAIDPDRAYTCRQMSAILGRSLRWSQDRARELAAVGEAAKFGPDYLVLGRSILDLAGEAALLGNPPALSAA